MSVSASSPDSLSGEFAAVPVAVSETTASLQVCVVARRQPDPVAGDFVLLRRFPSGRALLGCLCDRGGRICEWLELWLQAPVPEGPLPAGANAAGDESWTELAMALRAGEPRELYQVAEEVEPALPTWLNLETMAPWHPAYEGKFFRVCRDDSALENRSLPRYSLTRHRYAWVPAMAGESPFIPLTDGSEGGDLPLPTEATRFAPFNPTGGRMIVRRLAPVPVEDFAALLAGIPWAGPDQSLRHCRLAAPYTSLQDADTIRNGGRHFFTSRGGEAGRLVEALYLKLLLAGQCMKLVREHTSRLQLPFLNLSAESFRVRLGEGDFDLPLLWSATVSLVQPGVATPVPLPNTQIRYFRSLEPLPESIYRPEELTRRRKGTARVRLRAVLPPVQEGTVVQGTLNTPEDLRVEQHELIELTLPLAEGALTLYGHLDGTVVGGTGESAFRSVPQAFTAKERETLQAASGVIFTQVPMEIQTPLSSPCDLYSLGVLTLRLLFGASATSLPVIKDSLFSLAASLTGSHVTPEGMAETIRDFLDREPQWREALGPQHLVAEEISADAAAGLLPPALWAEILTLLLRLFPGRSPFAFCSDFADAPGLALHTVFDAPLAGFQRLQRLTRSLHLLDWTHNREIAGLLQEWARES